MLFAFELGHSERLKNALNILVTGLLEGELWLKAAFIRPNKIFMTQVARQKHICLNHSRVVFMLAQLVVIEATARITVIVLEI